MFSTILYCRSPFPLCPLPVHYRLTYERLLFHCVSFKTLILQIKRKGYLFLPTPSLTALSTEYKQNGNGHFLHGVHSIMMEKLAQPNEGAGCTPSRPPPLTTVYLPSRAKLWCTLQLRGQIHSSYFYSTPMSTLWYYRWRKPANVHGQLCPTHMQWTCAHVCKRLTNLRTLWFCQWPFSSNPVTTLHW